MRIHILAACLCATALEAQVQKPVARPDLAAKMQGVSVPGLPPTNVMVRSSTPAIQVVTWTSPAPTAGGFTFKVLRQVAPKAEWRLLTPAPIAALTFRDTIALLPNTAIYRVTAVSIDGREGFADYAFANPDPMVSPKAAKASQVGDSTVILGWDAIPKPYGYVIFGPGLPATGKVIVGSRSTDTVTGVPPGPATFRVAGWYLTTASTANAASVSLNVVRKVGSYTVRVLGFTVNHESGEGQSQPDGKDDEVYVAVQTIAFRRSLKVLEPRFQPYRLGQTRVYGDVTGFSKRVAAGSAPGGMGGLVTGDVVPGPHPSQAPNPSGYSGQYPESQSGQFPLVVPLGTAFAADTDFYVISPTVWQWNGDSTQFHLWWSAQRAILQTTKLNLASFQQSQQANDFPLVNLFQDATGAWTATSGDMGAGHDRAIGLTATPNGPRLLDRGIIITQEKIERALVAANASILVINVPIRETGTGDPADYTLQLQLRRYP